jgi:hypothetical protein
MSREAQVAILPSSVAGGRLSLAGDVRGVGLRYGVADPVHAQRVGLARAALQAASHDDDLVADGAPAESDQRAVDLVHHVVGVPHGGTDCPGYVRLSSHNLHVVVSRRPHHLEWSPPPVT